MRRVVKLTVAVLAIAILGSCAGYLLSWRASGGHWYTVRTASMGEAAPVGTLLWVEPAHFASLREGDIITFHPPGRASITYTHRIVGIDADGTLRTQGDINGSPDAWRLHRGDVVGKVAMRWWGIGWLIRAGPLLIIGAVILAALVIWATTTRWRVPALMVGVSALLALAIYRYRPLVRGQLLTFQPGQHGGKATFVSTGLLPARVHALHNGHITLRDGQVGSIVSAHANHHGRFMATLGPHIPFWWWVILVAACFLPSLWTLAIGRPRAEEPAPA